jgi:hypothetical protein
MSIFGNGTHYFAVDEFVKKIAFDTSESRCEQICQFIGMIAIPSLNAGNPDRTGEQLEIAW